MMVTLPLMNTDDTITIGSSHVLSIKDFREKDGSIRPNAASILLSDGKYVLVGVSRSEAVGYFIKQPQQDESNLKGE